MQWYASCSQIKYKFSGFHLNIFVLKLKSWILMIPRKFVLANTWNKSDQRLEMDSKVDSFAPAIGIWIWHCVQHFDFCDRKYPSKFFFWESMTLPVFNFEILCVILTEKLLLYNNFPNVRHFETEPYLNRSSSGGESTLYTKLQGYNFCGRG